jgi:soluble lytic murein transglycosylase-like protein
MSLKSSTLGIINIRGMRLDKMLITLLYLQLLHPFGRFEQVVDSKAANTNIISNQSFNVANAYNVREDDIKPKIEGIPLDDKLLDYIWNKSQENDLSYTFLLALAKTESDFNPRTESKTNDSGLYQLHRPTAKWIGKQLGVKNYNLHNPYTSVDFSVYYLCNLREQWRNQGLSEEDVFDMTVVSYNMGVRGTNRYVKRHNVEDNTYLNRVLANKEELEMNIVE